MQTPAPHIHVSGLLFQDGQVTLDEFITFECDIRQGKHAVRSKRSEVCIAVVSSVLEWWRSMKSQTLRAVVIAHFQLMSSIKVSFPDMDVRDPAADAAFVEIASNSTTVGVFKEALNEATGTVASLNVAIFEYIGCFVGPRHASRLIYSTMTAIGLLLAASMVPWALRRAVRGLRITPHTSKFIAAFEHYCFAGQLILIFLVYPALSTTIMRTFVCAEYAQDDKGNPTKWLVADTVVRCDFSILDPLLASNTTAAMAAAAAEEKPYMLLYAYSWVMVVVVILGFPTILYHRLWSWRHPFDRYVFCFGRGMSKYA